MPKSKFGFIDAPRGSDEHVFGSNNRFQGTILVPDGNWKPYLPPLEIQHNNRFDTYSCVTFAALNCLETILKKKYDIVDNRSDRFTSVASGTEPGRGNSIQAVAESIRKDGTVAEEIYPFLPDMSSQEFFKDLTQDLRNIGKDWLTKTQVNHEWMDASYKRFDPIKAFNALRVSPLHTAVDSRTTKTANFKQYDHSVMIYNAVKGDYFEVFNSYENCFQTFEWDYPFYIPKKYEIIELFNLPLNEYAMKLIRNSKTGAIYLVDSDNKKHHIVNMEALIEYFGNNTALNQDWVNVEPTAIDPVEEGEPIGLPATSLSDALKAIIARFGAFVSGKRP